MSITVPIAVSTAVPVEDRYSAEQPRLRYIYFKAAQVMCRLELRAKCFKIRAVTFDLWQTLLLERDGASSRRSLIRCRNLARVLERFGVQISTGQLASAFGAITPWLLSFWETDKEVVHQQQIRFVVERASKGSVQLKEQWLDELSQAYVSPILELPSYLNLDAPCLL